MSTRYIMISLAFLATSVLLAAAEHVVVLNTGNFDEFITKTDFAVVEFYAPWCGHCKQLEPEYEKAAEALQSAGSDIKLAKVNADEAENKPLAKRYDVTGFPTLKIFRKGAVQDYNGPREADGIIEYVQKQAGPASAEVSTKEEADAFVGRHGVAIFGVFSDFESDEFEVFLETASSLRDDYSFVHTKDVSILPGSNGEPLPSVPFVRIFKKFDSGFSDVTTFEPAAFKEQIEKLSTPIVVEMSKDPAARVHLVKVFDSDMSKALLFFDYGTENKEELTKAYNAVASEGKYNVKYIIGDEKENNHALEYFGVSEEDTPVLLIHDQKKDKKYIKKQAGPADFDAFIGDFEAGKLQPSIKSAPVPKSNDGPVKIVVATTFDDIVLKSGKNVMMEFYAPWCGHCKKLDPIYKKVGEAFKDDDSVVIAKMDSTANDVLSKEFDVQGFPTLYFIDAEGTISLYQGGRTKKDLVAYIKKHKKEPVAQANVSAEVAEEKDEL